MLLILSNCVFFFFFLLFSLSLSFPAVINTIGLIFTYICMFMVFFFFFNSFGLFMRSKLTSPFLHYEELDELKKMYRLLNMTLDQLSESFIYTARQLQTQCLKPQNASSYKVIHSYQLLFFFASSLPSSLPYSF